MDALIRARLASRNRNKIRELAALLPGWELEVLDADDYPPEEGDTYAENARAKAAYGRRFAAPDAWVLGEDSGIEVTGLVETKKKDDKLYLRITPVGKTSWGI